MKVSYSAKFISVSLLGLNLFTYFKVILILLNYKSYIYFSHKKEINDVIFFHQKTMANFI